MHSNYNSAGKKHARQEEVGDVNSRKKTFFTRWTFYSKNYLHLIPSDIIEVEEGICGWHVIRVNQQVIILISKMYQPLVTYDFISIIVLFLPKTIAHN